jgi:acetamidase/formamidase
VFGCGENLIRFQMCADVSVALWRPRSDRLLHMDELNQESLDGALTARRRGQRFAAQPVHGSSRSSNGRVHMVPSTSDTVRLGVFDSTLPNLLEIDDGDTLVYTDTWTHFLNRTQPGVSIEELAQMRREHPSIGPHSIIGPVGVRGAQPGDMIAVHYRRLVPLDWGVNFNNPGDIGTGVLPDQFAEGQVRYFELDLQNMRVDFAPGITLPLAPFQGTLGVAPPQAGVVSSVPPGQHAGNVDLRDLTEGSILYIPVWQPGAKIYTGDSHALQGDGEVNLTALETAMREMHIQVFLHKQPGWEWPFAETDTYWFALGMHPDLNVALRIALRNALSFLQRSAGLTALDAYALASMAVSFRITQAVDGNAGVHALIPKSLFSADLRSTMSIV